MDWQLASEKPWPLASLSSKAVIVWTIVKPLIKDTPKEDKHDSLGISSCVHSSEIGQPLYKGQNGCSQMYEV